MLKLYIVSGFLGSGKTTLVTALAKKLVEEHGRKVMLIVNDVGEIGVDGQLMKRLNTDVYELFGGCICGQLGSLIKILKEVNLKYAVDLILLEASGIAQPSRFMDTVRKFGPEEMATQVLALVDCSRWLELRQVMEGLLESQVKSAELVLLNKVDVVAQEVVRKVEEDILSLNPGCKLLPMAAVKEEDSWRLTEVMANG